MYNFSCIWLKVGNIFEVILLMYIVSQNTIKIIPKK